MLKKSVDAYSTVSIVRMYMANFLVDFLIDRNVPVPAGDDLHSMPHGPHPASFPTTSIRATFQKCPDDNRIIKPAYRLCTRPSATVDDRD